MLLPHPGFDPADLGAWLRYWAARGWPVFPLHGVEKVDGRLTCTCGSFSCKSPGKHPRTRDGVNDSTTDPDVLERWIDRWPDANVGGATAGKIALDVDCYAGAEWPTEYGVTELHNSGRGTGGHMVWRLTPEQILLGLRSSAKKLGPGLDVRTGAASYIVLPRSIHATTGLPYTLNPDYPQFPAACPDALIERLREVGSVAAPSSSGGRVVRLPLPGDPRPTTATREASTVRSLLVSLLSSPPGPGDRSWNDWLTQVAGHYARDYHNRHDLYLHQVQEAADKLNRQPGVTEPITPKEVNKIADSVWRSDQRNHPDRDALAACTEESGWLVAGDYEILCTVAEGPKDAKQVVLAPWSDFDLRVTRVILDQDQTALFEVDILRHRDRATIPAVVEARSFGDARKLAGWLAGYTVSIAQPDNATAKQPGIPGKLLRYLASQAAPTIQLSTYLGWHPEARQFLTHEGAITAAGPGPWTTHRPDPRLARSGSAPYHYGFHGTEDEAVDVLRRVLTFQHPTTAAVFGAWWAATLTKHQVMAHFSSFPILALQAASGTGKTSGFFSLMARLSGALSGSAHYTTAALRNTLAGNANAMVWLDDLDDPSRLFELIRVLTGDGKLAKMDADYREVNQFQLRATMLLSGEALGLSSQKALEERSVTLKPDTPTDRRSQLPGRGHLLQWEDITDLEVAARGWGEHGLAEIAGHLVSRAIRLAESVNLDELSQGQRPGRLGERSTFLLYGATLLDRMVGGGGRWVEPVRAWVDGATERSKFADNRLTSEVIPWALRYFGFPSRPTGASGGKPAWVEAESGTVWYSPTRLAETWEEYHHGKITFRVDSAQSLKGQARQLDPQLDEHRRRFKVDRNSEGGHKTFYWPLPEAAVQTVLDRAEGDDE